MTMFGNAIGLSPGNLGMTLFKPSAAPMLWWDPNNEGLPVVGAYRAIATVGSPWPLAPANYAESLQNWANPGTYDPAEIGGGPVNWAANVGWSGFNALARCLNTGIVPTLDQTWTVLIEYAAPGNNNLNMCGLFDSVVENGGLIIRDRGPALLTAHGSIAAIINNAPPLVGGNCGFAGLQPYRDSVPEAALIPAGGGTTDLTIYIGSFNANGIQANNYDGSIAALVIYSGTLTGVQFAAVDVAMGQL